MLEFFALLVGRRWQLQQSAPVLHDDRHRARYDDSAGPGRSRSAGESFACKRLGAICGPETLTTFGLVRSVGSEITAASVAISTAGSSSGLSAPDIGRLDGGQIALHVDHDVDAVFGVERLQGLIDSSEPDTWSLRVMTARPPSFSTAAATASEFGRDDASPILAVSARRSTWTIIGAAMQIGQWLAGQAGRSKAGRNEDNCFRHRVCRIPGRTVTNVDNAAGAYTGCQRPGKPVSHRRCQAPDGNRPAPFRPASGADFR